MLTNRVNCSGSTFNLTLFGRVVRDLRALYFLTLVHIQLRTIHKFETLYNNNTVHFHPHSYITIFSHSRYIKMEKGKAEVKNLYMKTGNMLISLHDFITMSEYIHIVC